jgi:hypothetical protein
MDNNIFSATQLSLIKTKYFLNKHKKSSSNHQFNPQFIKTKTELKTIEEKALPSVKQLEKYS